MVKRKTLVIAPKRDKLKIYLAVFFLCLMTVFFYRHGYIEKINPYLTNINQQEILKSGLFWHERKDVLGDIWDRLLGYAPTEPREQLAAGLFAKGDFAAISGQKALYRETEQEYYLDNKAAMAGWDEMKEKFGQVHLSEEVGIIIYHTHNAEDYKPSAGVSKSEGKNGGIAVAADAFSEAIARKYGIKTFHAMTLHDYPDWSHSYINSLKTIKALLNSYPEAKIVFDVHRDAGYTDKNPTTAIINGKPAAKILLVVGANHDNYQKNLAFAQNLEDTGAKLYPELIKGIHIAQSARYNQQVHPQAIIVEVGSDLNTQEEANYAMELFADICAEVYKNLN